MQPFWELLIYTGLVERGNRFCSISDKLSLIYITVREKCISLTLGPKLQKSEEGHVACHRLISTIGREEADAGALLLVLFHYAVPQQSL